MICTRKEYGVVIGITIDSQLAKLARFYQSSLTDWSCVPWAHLNMGCTKSKDINLNRCRATTNLNQSIAEGDVWTAQDLSDFRYARSRNRCEFCLQFSLTSSLSKIHKKAFVPFGNRRKSHNAWDDPKGARAIKVGIDIEMPSTLEQAQLEERRQECRNRLSVEQIAKVRDEASLHVKP